MNARPAARVLLVDGGYDPEDLPSDAAERYRAAACLFWLAPATKRRVEERVEGPCFTLPDLIDSEMAWGRDAYLLAVRFLDASPRYRDSRWRRYATEPVYHELRWLHLLLRLAELAEGLRRRWEVEKLFLEGRLRERRRDLLAAVLESFPGLAYMPEEGLEPPARAPVRPPARERLARRLREVRLTGEWRAHLGELWESLDPRFRQRARWGRLAFRHRPAPGGTVFLSSYKNNTRSLLPFRDQVPGPVHWLLANLSARRGLDGVADPRFWLWAFGTGRQGGPAAVDDGGEDVDGAPPGFAFWRRSSPAVRSWLEVEQHLLRTLTACWERYLDEAEPRLVVVANQLGLEGWLAGIARRRGIPVLQVMHGILGGYFYTGTPVLSDAMVVFGEVWRSLWPASERGKIVAYNPGWIVPAPRRRDPLKRLTFFSWPLETQPFYNAPEFQRRYVDLFARLLRRGDVAVTVRCHPQEDPSELVERWRRRHGEPPAGLRLSKSEPLEDVVAVTDVALMFRSTVMLDCLASGIPVVLPGWIDFAWNRELEGFRGLHLADDFEDLEATIEAWLRDPPDVDRDRLRRFLRPSGEGREEVEKRLADLVAGRRIISRERS